MSCKIIFGGGIRRNQRKDRRAKVGTTTERSWAFRGDKMKSKR